MEQFCSSCVCHIIPPQLTQRGCGCTCHHHGETATEDEWRSPKRRRLDEPSLQVFPAVTFMVPHHAAASTGYPQIGNYANVDANILSRASCTRPSSGQSVSQNNLEVNNPYTLQQGLSRSRGGELASTTYVATSYTLSPRSQETPLSVDQRRSTSPGQELGAENSLAGLNNFEFSFNFGQESSRNDCNSNLLPFAGTGRGQTLFC